MKKMLAIALCAFSVNAVSSEFIVKGVTISEITSVDNRPGATYQNADLLSFAGSTVWASYPVGSPGSVVCTNGVAVLPNNAFQKSIALSAFMAGKAVTIVVNNSLPSIADGPNNYCTATLIYATK